MPTINAPINAVSTALLGGTQLSTLAYEAFDDWMGFQQQVWNPINSRVGSTGPANPPALRRGWINSTDTPTSDVLSQDLANSAAATTVYVANPAYYTIGSVIVIDTERMLVTGRGSNYVTVERDFANDSGALLAAHTANAVITIGLTALTENADDPDGPVTPGERGYNVHQMVITAWTFSHRSQKVATQEFQSGNMMNTILQQKMNRDIPKRLEIALLTQRRNLGTGVEASAFGGLDQPEFIGTRTDLSNVPLEERHINDALYTAAAIVGDLGNIEIHGPSLVGRILASYYQGSRRLTATENKISTEVPVFQTPNGTVTFVENQVMSTIPMSQDKLYIMKTADIKRAPFSSDSNWQTGAHETQGWYDRQYIRGDITYLFPNEDGRVELFNFDTTTANYPAYA